MWKKKDPYINGRHLNWRSYQVSLQKQGAWSISRESKKSIFLKRAILTAGLLSLVIPAALSYFNSEPNSAQKANLKALPQKPPDTGQITKKDVKKLIETTRQKQSGAGKTVLEFDGLERADLELNSLELDGLTIDLTTSIDQTLQTYLAKRLDRKNSRYIGIVVMNAQNGRILAMVGFNKDNQQNNPCLSGQFPAASIFKIVTAAAAIDYCGYNAGTKLKFNGRKHTLYKRQLRDKVNRYTNNLSFADSFAQSVNPVFGKIGALMLGKDILEKYATAFGFNESIDFELPVTPSKLKVNDDSYHWAEVASGFNNDTTLSPLHGAVMVSAVLNAGRMKSPTIIETLSDKNGKIIYRSDASWHGQAMTKQAATSLISMMKTTIRAGTGRKAFRGAKKDSILSKLHIGGKTGSIFNRAHDTRFDWFAGFASEKNGNQKLAIAVMVGHQEYIGRRAAEYARLAMAHYYKDYFVKVKGKTNNSDS
ncbi:MAG: PbpA [Desulfobacteraceae bacterium]|nr:PbpA [Desulfobacteraceae bacterium]